MKWSKKGCVFSPGQFKTELSGMVYAQSPQALPIGNGVRVYFSTRTVDSSGKFLSHIAFADFSRDFKEVREISRGTVIPLGGLGDFDEHGIFPIHICKIDNKIFGYTTGWSRRRSVSADASIGLAVSRDGGRTFEKLGRGPVLTSSLYEPFLIGDAFVIRVGEVFHMWYICGKRWIESNTSDQPERVYKIAHAVSKDGISWAKEGNMIISDAIGPDECQALPSVLEYNGVFHMVFCFRDAVGFRSEAGRGYRLGYAYSTDLRTWKRADDALGLKLSGEGWDGQMMCYPHIFSLNGQVALLYNGNNFGREGFGLALLQSDINEHVKL